IFQNQTTHVIVYYYINTSFPEAITPAIKKQIKKASVLIWAGIHPHQSIIEMMPEKFSIVTFSSTIYEADEGDQKYNTISWYLSNYVEPKISFIDYFLIDWQNGKQYDYHDV